MHYSTRLVILAALGLTLLVAPITLARQSLPVPHQSPTATSAPAPGARSDPFVTAQAAAMLSAHVVDLGQSAAWDRYTIIAALNPEQLTLRGTLTLEVTNRSRVPYERLYFRLYPNHPDFGGRLDVSAASVAGRPVASGTEQRDTLFWIALPEALAPGAQTRVALSFQTSTPRNASARSFGAHNFEAGLWSLANSYPILARHRDDAGWDRRPIESRGDFTVTDVALYDVTVDVAAGWALISSGSRVSAAPVTQGVRRERFVSGPQREFYLGATQGLDQASAEVEGTRVVSHFQRDDAQAGRRALEAGEQALRIFNARFGPYPLAELEIVQGALTQFLGMEYPGVVLIEQRLYERNRQGLESTVVHEVAHQWWYSQVGNDAQSEPWLDEGMASYSQVLYYEGIGAAEQAAAELRFFRELYTQARDARRDAPLGSPPTALRGNYVAIIYAKGALFFHTLRAQIGDAAFERFLRGYYATERYGKASGPELLQAAEAACTCDLDTLYHDWVLTAAPVRVP